MFKRYFLCACLVAFFLSAGVAQAGEKYINGIDANYPPFAYMGKSGKPEGFDVDSMDWIAKKMGFTVEHKAMDWDTIVASLLAKKIDMVCSGMSISPERQAQVAFSNPYFSVRKYLVVKSDSKLDKADLLTGGKKLGVQRGTNEAEWLEQAKDKNQWNYTLAYYDSAPMAVEDLLNGRIDAAAIDSAPANDAKNKAQKPVKFVGEFADPDNFGVAVRKEDNALLDKINKGYDLLKKDAYWKELQKKYDVTE